MKMELPSQAQLQTTSTHSARGFKKGRGFFIGLCAGGFLFAGPSGEVLAGPAKAASPKNTVIEGSHKPFGNPNAPQGGTFNINIIGEPATLHPITGSDGYRREVINLVCDSLLTSDPETNDFLPGLAERTEISADGTSFIFRLRSGAKWHDGKALTAEDVKFSFDAIFEPKYEAAHMRPYFEGIASAEVVDPLTVRFVAKNKYFGNLLTLASLTILPKHVYGDVDKSKKMNKTLLCSGPYKLEKYEQGQSITLVRNKDWWGNSVEHFKGEHNFERIRMRFIKEEDIAIEMLKKGDLDYDELGSEAFMKKAVGPEWGKKVFKEKVENLRSKPYGYLGWNQRRELFKDRDVRQALALLFNRQEIISKYLFNLSLPATGPWYQQSVYADPGVKPVPFDPKKAVELLKKVGWSDTDKNGILDKVVDGKKTEFHFTLIYGSKDTEKYWVMYQSDLKKVGIDMQLQLLEWNAMLKAVDGFDFDVIAMSWGGGDVDLDPKQIWHSSSAVKGGSNFVSYKNPDVDGLIDQGRAELDKKKRIAIFRQVYGKIAADYPYLFLFNTKFDRYAYSSRVKTPKATFPYTIGRNYWWMESAK